MKWNRFENVTLDIADIGCFPDAWVDIISSTQKSSEIKLMTLSIANKQHMIDTIGNRKVQIITATNYKIHDGVIFPDNVEIRFIDKQHIKLLIAENTVYFGSKNVGQSDYVELLAKTDNQAIFNHFTTVFDSIWNNETSIPYETSNNQDYENPYQQCKSAMDELGITDINQYYNHLANKIRMS